MPDEFEDPVGEMGDPARSYSGEEGGRDPRVERAEAELLGLDGVEGVGLGRTGAGEDAIVVYVRDADAVAHLPKAIAGLPLIVQPTGSITAY